MTDVGIILFFIAVASALIGLVVGVVAMFRWRGPLTAKLAAGVLLGFGAFIGVFSAITFAGQMYLAFS